MLAVILQPVVDLGYESTQRNWQASRRTRDWCLKGRVCGWYTDADKTVAIFSKQLNLTL